MNGRFFVILLIFCVWSCLAASHVGYLAYVGPSPIRFYLLTSIETYPEIDYNPKPAELTTNQIQTATNKSAPNQESQSTPSPEFFGPPVPESIPPQQTISVQDISSQNQQSQVLQQQNQAITSSDANAQVISPQVFVNYFKQNPFLTNNPTQVIVVPNFTPPPPAMKPSSSATYNIK